MKSDLVSAVEPVVLDDEDLKIVSGGSGVFIEAIYRGNATSLADVPGLSNVSVDGTHISFSF